MRKKKKWCPENSMVGYFLDTSDLVVPVADETHIITYFSGTLHGFHQKKSSGIYSEWLRWSRNWRAALLLEHGRTIYIRLYPFYIIIYVYIYI